MEFSLEARTARLSVGELAEFKIGPRESGGGQQGLWRAQLGTHWHQQLRSQVGTENRDALFEIPITGEVMQRGWRFTLNGRIDQLIPPAASPVSDKPLRGLPSARLREVKSVLRELPAAEEELRAEYPAYFVQLATYLALARLQAPIHPTLLAATPVHGELVFVEGGSGLIQTIAVTAEEERLFTVQLDRVVDFLELQHRARERLRNLRFSPAFATLRAGQERIQPDLQQALDSHSVVLLEAPTGFGKTGALLEAALGLLREGRFARLVYLTSKSTGQLQVVNQLAAMAGHPSSNAGTISDLEETMTAPTETPNGQGLAVWHVRNKREHCINTVFHCVRESCRYLQDLESRWAASGLSRFQLFENEARSMEALRSAGATALICPYEITRTALAFQDVWVGDYNYVFSPSSRGLFGDQPGYDPARTLLIVDEAHNLPSRVADAYSHAFTAGEASLVTEDLHRLRAHAPLLTAWEQWSHFLGQLNPCDALELGPEDDARHLLETIAKHLTAVPLDYAALGANSAEILWRVPALQQELAQELPRLWWVPRRGELSITCLDAAKVIGPTLRSFGAALLASATLGPADLFVESCGLAMDEPLETERSESPARLGKLTKRDTRKLFKNVSTGADLLQATEQRSIKEASLVRASTPWRDGAYRVAVDLRVDTSYQKRESNYGTTAATIEVLSAAAHRRLAASDRSVGKATPCLAIFFPSYHYAERIERELAQRGSPLRVSLQPRVSDLAAQRRWAEDALISSDALFLVLGSSFAEGIDFLGGRIETAMIVGPALPEVNAVQRARIATLRDLGRDAAFKRVYQVPGIQKVNQALGRLVRSPGQHARVLLHCRRFAELAYSSLLAPEYQFGIHLETDAELTHWLDSTP